MRVIALCVCFFHSLFIIEMSISHFLGQEEINATTSSSCKQGENAKMFNKVAVSKQLTGLRANIEMALFQHTVRLLL